MNYLSEEEYKKVFELAPVCCVDLFVCHKDKFLLAKRTMEPAKGEWWFPGGRVRKGEKLEGAIKRIAKDELGISVKGDRVIGVFSLFFDKGPFGLRNVHNIVVCFLVYPVDDDPNIVLDKTHTEYKWFDKCEGLHPYIRRIFDWKYWVKK